MNKNNNGFTLVELLSVIVIMGIILLVAIPSVFGISKTIKDNMYCTKVHNLESAAKLYGNDYSDDFDDKGYIKVDVKTIIDNNLYKKEIDECTLGDEDKGCVVDPRDESVMDNKTITIVKTGSRFYAYYDFVNEEDIALCEGKKETDKFKHYDVALDNQGATYPGTTIVRDVVFGHEMPNIDIPRKEYKVRLIDEYNHLDKTGTVKYTFRGYFAAKNGGVKYYDENGKNVHYYNLPEGRPLYAVWTDKSINLPKQTLTGYEFRGWFTSRTGEDFIMESGNYTPTSDITLYARWIPKVSTITLDSQSATFKGTERITATYNEVFPDITIPRKEYTVTLNYNGSGTPNTTLISKNIFDGYWSQRNGKGTQYYNSNGNGIGVSKFTSNAAIYASWKNGSITLPSASRPGYKLTGWYTAASGGTKVGNAGAKYNASKNITLYAQWKITDAVLKGGSSFNKDLKTLSDNTGSSSISVFTKDINIKKILRSSTPPPSGVTTKNVADSASETPVYAWFDNGIIYLYSVNPKIYMNRYSSNMFSKMSGISDLDLSIFDSSKVTDMSLMFYNMNDLVNLDISSLNTSNVVNMSHMFSGDKKITSLKLNNFDTSKVTNMTYMFEYCESLKTLDLRSFNTSNVTSMYRMFYGVSGLTDLNLSHFDTSKVTNMAYMFASMTNLTSLDLYNFNTSNVTNMSYMFYDMYNVLNLNLSHFDTSKVTDMSSMFSACSNLTSLNIKNFNTSNVTSMRSMFSNMRSILNLDLSNFNTSKVIDMSWMFNGNDKLINLNINSFDTSNVQQMGEMFGSCRNLKVLDLRHFNTANVVDMGGMFSVMWEITSLNVSSFNTSKVVNMAGMFSDCYKLSNLDIKNFDTSKVTDMTGMFRNSRSLVTLDLSNFDTSSLENVSGKYMYASGGYTMTTGDDYQMFENMKSLTTIYVGNKWDISKVIPSNEVFKGSNRLRGGAGTVYSDSHMGTDYMHVDGVGGPGYLTRK